MLGLPITFTAPFVLVALLALPLIWWLLRVTPPKPRREMFPPTRLLAEITKKEETPQHSPWWLTALRLLMAALAIFALSGPLWQPDDVASNENQPLLIVVDSGWTSARSWQARSENTKALLEEAKRAGRPVALLSTTERQNAELRFDEADLALEKLAALQPQPFREDRATAAELVKNLGGTQDAEVIWLTSDLATSTDTTLAEAISATGGNVTVLSSTVDHSAIMGIENGARAMRVLIRGMDGNGDTLNLTLRSLDQNRLTLSEQNVEIPAGEDVIAEITLPIELRNQIESLTLGDGNDAASVYLVDGSAKRRRAGLISGSAIGQSQPLLDPLIYLSRALEPFADLRIAQTPNLAEAIPDMINNGASIIFMADVGKIPAEERERLEKWLERGGTLVRFAGTRLAASEDPLSPVKLRTGSRNLGGSLSWEEPQQLAKFSANGPFANIAVPQDITVSRQVLAEPDFELSEKTWAELADGTPLITGQPHGNGWLVLFHVTADATWSNLPISGAYVEMLTELVSFSRVPASALSQETSEEASSLPPLQTLNAFGTLTSPTADAEPVKVSDLKQLVPNIVAPPGLYGATSNVVAINLMKPDFELKRLNAQELLPQATFGTIGKAPAFDFRPLLFTLVFALLMLDAIAVAYLNGALSIRKQRFAAVALLATAFALAPVDNKSYAQNSDLDEELEFALKAANGTRLAYVETGKAELDEITRRGLVGLSQFIAQRTALEPAEPMAVDISKDDLSFFSLLYWSVDADVEVPDSATMARIDAFMKSGGSVLFDTRDQIDAGLSGNTTPAIQQLRRIVANLDVPALEPVPENHVLTRSFYLLDNFPGRWDGSPLWVESTNPQITEEELNTNQADGVSSILITANDFVGAWAVGDNGAPLLPTTPADPNQRVYAFRTGVNIVMYALTGNYKADQVHIPALLERLGQ